MRQSVLRNYDTRNVESITAYSHYLTMKGQLIGLTAIDGHKPTLEELELKKEICRTCERMAKTMSVCPAHEISPLTGYYTLLYTMGYHRLPETSLLEKQRDRLLKYWMAGDKTIQESDVYGMLMDSVRNPLAAVPAGHRQTLDRLRESWTGTLKKYGTFPDITTYERYRRLSLIMKDSLDAYFDGESAAAKGEWFEKNEIADLSTVGTKILTAYRLFIRSLFPAVLGSDKMLELDISVLQELGMRKDLDYYDRKAYQLALAFEMQRKG